MTVARILTANSEHLSPKSFGIFGALASCNCELVITTDYIGNMKLTVHF